MMFNKAFILIQWNGISIDSDICGYCRTKESDIHMTAFCFEEIIYSLLNRQGSTIIQFRGLVGADQ